MQFYSIFLGSANFNLETPEREGMDKRGGGMIEYG